MAVALEHGIIRQFITSCLSYHPVMAMASGHSFIHSFIPFACLCMTKRNIFPSLWWITFCSPRFCMAILMGGCVIDSWFLSLFLRLSQFPSVHFRGRKLCALSSLWFWLVERTHTRNETILGFPLGFSLFQVCLRRPR